MNGISIFFKYIPYLFLVLLLVYAFNMFYKVKNLEDKYDKQTQLYEAITDTLYTYKNKDSLNVSIIKTMETENAKDFAKIKNLEDYNLKLQEIVKLQGRDISNLKTALIIATETQFVDTLKYYYPIGGDTIVFSKSILLDSVKNNWIDATWGFRRGKSFLRLKTFDELSIVIKNSKKGNYAEVTNYNPYSSTKDMRILNVTVPKQKKRGIGYSFGIAAHYGIFGKRIDVGPYIGVGFNGNLFEW